MNITDTVIIVQGSVLTIGVIVLVIALIRGGSEESRLSNNIKIKKLRLNEKLLDERLTSKGEPTLSDMINSGQISQIPEPTKSEDRAEIKGFKN